MQQLLKMSRSTPRRVLGLKLHEGSSEARRAYYTIVRMIHPDKCDVPGATAAFQIAQKAYERAKTY